MTMAVRRMSEEAEVLNITLYPLQTEVDTVSNTTENWTIHQDNKVMETYFGMTDPYVIKLQNTVLLLHTYYLPSIYAIAILGNIVSIIALSDVLLIKSSTTQYLIGIFLAEACHVVALLHTWLEEIGVDTGTYRIGGWCQFATFVTRITRFLSIWYTVVLALDRTIWICCPLFAKTFCHHWRAKIIIVGMVIIAVVVYLNISILYDGMPVGPKIICAELRSYEHTHDKLAKGDVFFNSLLPILLVTIMLIISYIFMCSPKKCTDNQKGFYLQGNGDKSQHNASATHITITQSNGIMTNDAVSPSRDFMNNTGIFTILLLVFIILAAPQDMYRLSHVIMDLSLEGTLRGFLLEQIFQYVRCTKYAINVFILFVAYPLFRKAVANFPQRVSTCWSSCAKQQKSCQSPSIEVSSPEEV